MSDSVINEAIIDLIDCFIVQSRETPLHYSAALGNVSVLGVLVNSIKPSELQRVVNKQDSLGRSALLVAARNGHVPSIIQLLQNQVI